MPRPAPLQTPRPAPLPSRRQPAAAPPALSPPPRSCPPPALHPRPATSWSPPAWPWRRQPPIPICSDLLSSGPCLLAASLEIEKKGGRTGGTEIEELRSRTVEVLRRKQGWRCIDLQIDLTMDLLQTKLNICEGEDGTESSLGDVLIFPDMIRGLTHFDVDNFVEEVLVKDVEWLPGSPEVIRGSYVFVCAHGSRDKRCGVCGPALITRFKEEIEGQGLDGQVAVSGCSHVGAHKYVGNVIIFSSDAKGEVTGHWYGYVTPDDVPVLLQKHIGQGEIVDHLWRFLPLESSNKVRISRSKVIPRPQASGLSESAIGYNYSDPIYYMLAYFS